MTVDLAVLGNLLLDDVVHEDGRTRMAQPGGAALYVALGARLWGVSVGMVSVVGDDYPEAVLDALDERGIDLAGVRRLDGPSLRTWLLYEGRRRQIVHRLGGPSHFRVSPRAHNVPPAWLRGIVHLAPMPFTLQKRLIAHLGDVGLLSLDPHELLTVEVLPVWRLLLSEVDVLFLSEDEMMFDGALEDPRPVLARLGSDRLRRIFFKRGARGGLLHDVDDDAFHPWLPRTTAVVDATGAGDAFAGGVLAGLARYEPVDAALELGVVSASFALEGEGADGLLAAGPEKAEARLREWFG